MRSGEPYTQLIAFSEGSPDAAIAWTLRDGDGTQVTTGSVTPAIDDVSAVITVPGVNNTVPNGELYVERELSWSYAVGGVSHYGCVRYQVEAFLGYGVSREGVRDKIGVSDSELEDGAIDLVTAYSTFRETVGVAALAAVTTAHGKLVVRDAIEALAALRLIPTLQIKLASKEASGVSQFQRQRVKWDELSAHLNEMVAAGYTLTNPSVDSTGGFGNIFAVVVRTDPITGEAP